MRTGSLPALAQQLQPEVALGVGVAVIVAAILGAVLLFWRRSSAARRDIRSRERLLAAIREGTLELDAKGRCTFANPAAAQMLGLPADEIRGETVGSILRLPAGEELPSTLRGERELPGETARPERVADVTLQRADGTSFVADLRSVPLVQEGKLQGTLVMFGDVSERAEMTDALEAARLERSSAAAEARRATEERDRVRDEAAAAREAADAARRQLDQQRMERDRTDRALADLLPELAWSASPDGRRIRPGARWMEYTGVDEREVESRVLWHDLVGPEERERSLQRWQHCAGTGEPCETEHRLRRYDGEYRWFRTRARAIRDDDGIIIRWVGLSADIQEAKESESSLREAVERIEMERKRLASVFLQAPVAVAILRGKDHVFEVANAPYLELLGTRDAAGRRAGEVLAGTRSETLLAAFDRVYETGETFTAHEVAVSVDSGMRREDRWYDVICQPLFEVGGDVSGVFVLAIDVSGRVRGRREVDMLQEEVRRANRSRSDFLGAMGHELKTPLNAIAGYVDLVILGIHGPVTDAQVQALERVKRSQRHLLSLIDDILSYARLEAGRVRFRSEPVMLNTVIADTEAMLSPQVREKGMGLQVAPCPEDLAALGDLEKVQQIVVNLMTNALKYTDPGGRIEVRCGQAGAKVMVQVSDTGLGIPEDKIASIFEPFVQVDRAVDRQVDGVGLGLAISRDLARGMGGDLTVESVLGEGSTFSLTLPRAPAPQRSEEEDSPSAPMVDAGRAAG
jgi:PAS domain S-box-containing protein